jgi:hypothetical protein
MYESLINGLTYAGVKKRGPNIEAKESPQLSQEVGGCVRELNLCFLHGQRHFYSIIKCNLFVTRNILYVQARNRSDPDVCDWIRIRILALTNV